MAESTNTTSPNREAVAALLRAAETIEARGERYGDPRISFERIAAGWSVILRVEVTPEMVPLMMIWLKIVRETASHQNDNLVDILGFGSLAMETYRGPRS